MKTRHPFRNHPFLLRGSDLKSCCYIFEMLLSVHRVESLIPTVSQLRVWPGLTGRVISFLTPTFVDQAFLRITLAVIRFLFPEPRQ